MILQKILYPDEKKNCDIKELFYRGGVSLVTGDSSVKLNRNDVCSFDTYFNSFSLGKWLKYTIIQNLQFTFEILGNPEAIKVDFYRSEGKIDDKKLSDLMVSFYDRDDIVGYSEAVAGCLDCTTSVQKSNQTVCGNKIICEIDFSDISSDSVIYPVITAKEDVTIKNIQYETQADDKVLNNVRLAAGICTFKREEFVKRNVQQLLDCVINNEESVLHDKLEIYISDNGQTLPLDIFANENVHVFRNINLGGSAGFTRTIIESLINNKQKGFTHIILMDDDIVLPVSTLERNFVLLQLLKKQYQDSMIGGSMLTMKHMHIQCDSGAKLYVKSFYPDKHFFNLKNWQAVACNELKSEVNYNGWWYCCIPACVVEKNKLPLPFFIHYDDAEYGVRNSENELVLFNGLCVWHPDFIGKSPAWISYYDYRNGLISSCLYDFGVTKDFIMSDKTFPSFNTETFFDALIFSPKSAVLLLKALKDFCKGPGYFMNQDACGLQKELLDYKIEWKTLDELNIDMNALVKHPFRKYRISRLIQILLFFIPVKKGTKLVDMKNKEYPFFARNLFCYNPKTEKAYFVDMTECRFFRKIIAFMYYKFIFYIKYDKLKKEWINAKDQLTSLEFWNGYLKLK